MVAATAMSLLVLTTALLVVRDRELARGQEELARHEALDGRAQFRQEWKAAQLLLNGRLADRAQREEGRAVAHHALARYQVLDNPAWPEQPAVRRLPDEDQSQAAYGRGRAIAFAGRQCRQRRSGHAAEATDGRGGPALNQPGRTVLRHGHAPGTLWTQAARLVASLGKQDEAQRLLDRAKEVPAGNVGDARAGGTRAGAARPMAQGGCQFLRRRSAKSRRTSPPGTSWATATWTAWPARLRPAAATPPALPCGRNSTGLTSTAVWPSSAAATTTLPARTSRGHSSCGRTSPKVTSTAGLAYQGLQKYAEADKDLTQALTHGAAASRVLLLRSQCASCAAIGRRPARPGGRTAQQPTDEEGWLTRGYVRGQRPEGGPGRLCPRRRGNPRSLPGLQNQAHVLAEKLGDNTAAIGKLDALLGYYPDYAVALASRGVLRGRLGQRAEAQQDARAAVLRDSRAPILYQVAGIYALTAKDHPDDRREALHCSARPYSKASASM